ncbi:MAG TPA: substrate-binding domain-containing protein [Anaeromyxobacter sp.]|nr:substrate-binding domain-containing protein [Anaeromyxobacter sp.]
MFGTTLRCLALALLVAAPIRSAPRPRKVIGVSLLTLQHQFFRDLRTGLEEKAVEYDWDVVVVAGEFDASRQARQVDDFLARHVDAIVVAPCDSVEIGAPIERANKAGVPVFTTDIASTSRLGKVVAHVASDNYAGGRRAGALMVKALGGRGDVVLVTHPGVTSVIDRVRGFKDVVANARGIRILAEVPAWGQRARAAEVVEDLVARLPEVRGVFAINDDSALGALAAVTAAGKAGKVVIIGYDATPEAREAIGRGHLYGDVVQYPYKIGALTIQAVRDHFAGRRVPAFIPVETGVYTVEDARKGK